MGSKVQLVYVICDALFLITGIVILAFCVIVGNSKDEVPTDGRQAARDLLYRGFPLSAGIGNAVMIFVTFLATLPGLASSSRGFLKLAGYLALVCAIFSMILGLILWLLTLTLKAEFAPLFSAQSDRVKSLMQGAFNCCGYYNSTSAPFFVTDATCPSPAAAALLRGCISPIASFNTLLLDQIFTALFGMVGVDAIFIVATASLLKERKERERFRHIDEKNGVMTL